MVAREAKDRVNSWISEGLDSLLVTGARQIGKTYLIRECLQEQNIPYLEMNFIDHPEYKELFEEPFSVQDFLLRVSLLAKEKLIPRKTVIFLDEVQENKEIVTKIKFLVEDGTYRYVMSGSLLGVELKNIRSVPVGYMRVLDMFPMNLCEFYRAIGISESLLETLRNCYEKREPVDEFVHEKLLQAFYVYLIIGGMPEAVAKYVETNDLKKVAVIHRKIIRLYKQDFTKYEEKYGLRLKEIYDAVPAELNEKNKRFFINHLGKGAVYDRVKNDFLWLKDAGVVLPAYNVTEPKSPLIISEKRNLFKLFLSDVGLLTSLYPAQVKLDILSNRVNVNNGALFENAVAQELAAHEIPLYYFNGKKQGELDFVIELDGEALPIEVKSGKAYKKHSALDNVLGDKNYGIDEAFVLCSGNVEQRGKRTYLPVYMVMFIKPEELPDELVYRVDLSGL